MPDPHQQQEFSNIRPIPITTQPQSSGEFSNIRPIAQPDSSMQNYNQTMDMRNLPFWKEAVKGFGKSALQPVALGAELIDKLPGQIPGHEIVPKETVNKLKATSQTQGLPQEFGAGLETAAEMLAAEGIAKTALLKIPGLAKYAPLVNVASSAIGSGTPSAIRGQNPTIPAAVGAAGSGLAELAPKLAGPLESSAEKNYQRVLNPTKVTTKFDTQKIMPQLTEERPIAMTRSGLAEKASGEAEKVGQAIEQKVSGIQGNIGTQPVIDSLEKLKQSFVVNGVSLRPEVEGAINTAQNQLRDMATNKYPGIGPQQNPPEISMQDAVKARRILDQAVAEVGGYSGKPLSDVSLANVRKATANSLREELAKSSPDLAELNSKFHFWNTLSDVMEQTIQRKTGQATTGLLPTVETAAAGAAGLAKSGASGAAGYAGAMYLLGKATRSTGWQTISAATKMSIADALASGSFHKVIDLLGKAGAATTIQLQAPASNASPR